MTTDLIYAPWSGEQVTALNTFQQRGNIHPFTCGAVHSSGRSPLLVATSAGWICPDPSCDYTQDWAHAFMAAPAAAQPTGQTHGLTVQQADALWDAVAIPGPHTPTFTEQHDRVCRAVAGILAELPTGQTGLRDRITKALADALMPRYGGPQHNTPGGLPLTATAEEIALHRAQPLAEAVLAVLPPPIDRADILREVADICDEAGAVYTSKALNEHADAAYQLMARFQRKANEAEYVATPCSVGGCDPGGEPCTTHERLMAHAEGDHELCAPDCGATPAKEA